MSVLRSFCSVYILPKDLLLADNLSNASRLKIFRRARRYAPYSHFPNLWTREGGER